MRPQPIRNRKGLLNLRGRVEMTHAGKVDFKNLIFSKFLREIYPQIPLDAHASGTWTHPSKILPMALYNCNVIFD